MVPENVEEIINNTPPKQSKGSINLAIVEGVERFVLTSFFSGKSPNHQNAIVSFFDLFLIGTRWLWASLQINHIDSSLRSTVSVSILFNQQNFARVCACVFVPYPKKRLLCKQSTYSLSLDSLIRIFSLCFDKARVHGFFTVPGFLDRLHKNV